MSTRRPAGAPRRSSRRSARTVAVALVLQLVASLGGLAALSSAERSADPGALRGRTAPSVVETPAPDPRVEREAGVRAVLAQRAAALLARDRDAFLASVHPSVPAFRDRQAALFDALAEVPLTSWSYELDPTRTQPPDTRLDLRYGDGDWWAPDVVLRYALDGFDAEATYAAQKLTFVRLGSGWAIGSDDDFAAAGEASVRGLWDSGPVVAVRGERSLVLGHPGSASFLQALADEADAAVPRVTAVWGPDWSQSVVVLVPSDQQELSGILGQDLDLSQIAAVATAELPDVDGDYRPVGDRVIVNPPNFAKLGTLGRQVVLTHEVAHVATRRASGPDVPVWLAEGLADYIGYEDVPVEVSAAARELRAAVRAGDLPVALPLGSEFGGGNPALASAYEQSWLAVRLLVEQHGLEAFLRFYRTVGASRGAGGTAALEQAFGAEFGTSTAVFTEQWREYLVRTFS